MVVAIPAIYFLMKKLIGVRAKIVKTAKKYIGEKEIEPNMGFINPVFQKVMYDLGNWRPGFEWCASFARMIWLSALDSKKSKVAEKLLSPSSQMTYDAFSKDNSGFFEISSVPKPGAIAIWRSVKEPGKGHAGIFIGKASDKFLFIEGNKGQKVSLTSYTLEKMLNYSSSMKLRGFINLK